MCDGSEPGLRASLQRLQLEYVDVVFANRPDPNTPIEGTCAETLHSGINDVPGSPELIKESNGRSQGLNCPRVLLPSSCLEETVRAMTHVINQGMAMYWGTSRWSSMEIMVSQG